MLGHFGGRLLFHRTTGLPFTDYDYKVWKARHDSWEKEQDFQRSERAKDNAFKRAMRGDIKDILILFAPLLLIIIVFAGLSVSESVVESKRISVPYSVRELDDLSVGEVKEILKSAGFIDISIIGTEKKLFNKANSIKSISINGNTKFKAGDRFNKSDKVIITYYRDEG